MREPSCHLLPLMTVKIGNFRRHCTVDEQAVDAVGTGKKGTTVLIKGYFVSSDRLD